jgi:hypothetical protein
MKKLMTVLLVGSAFAMGSVAVAAKDDAPKAEKKDKKAKKAKAEDKAAAPAEGDKPADAPK